MPTSKSWNLEDDDDDDDVNLDGASSGSEEDPLDAFMKVMNL